LHLEQEVVLRGATDRAVQENDLRTRATKLVDHEHLMSIATGKAIRSVDINTLDMSAGNGIPQPLEGRAGQDRTAVAFVDIALIRFKLKTIGGDALTQRHDLAGDRVVARLAFARHTRIERTLTFGHASPPAAVVGIFAVVHHASSRFDRGLVRRTVGTRRA
jgi:hypothetical protein